MAGGQLGQGVAVGLAGGQLLALGVGGGGGQGHVADVHFGGVVHRGLSEEAIFQQNLKTAKD